MLSNREIFQKLSQLQAGDAGTWIIVWMKKETGARGTGEEGIYYELFVLVPSAIIHDWSLE